MKTPQQYRQVLDLAAAVLKKYEGDFLEFPGIAPDYIVAKFKGKKFSIVFYPHKTSAGNHHLRIRVEDRRNVFKASEIMWELANLENSCTFNVKNAHAHWGEDAFRQAIIQGTSKG